jgi:hypothetical protein
VYHCPPILSNSGKKADTYSSGIGGENLLALSSTVLAQVVCSLLPIACYSRGKFAHYKYSIPQTQKACQESIELFNYHLPSEQ